MVKRQTNLTLEDGLIKTAKDIGLNISMELNECLAELVGGKRTPFTVRYTLLARAHHELKERVRELQDELRAARKDSRERPGPGTGQPSGLKSDCNTHLERLPRPEPSTGEHHG
ncbi:unnamed protein product [marine sediment metagenome]|uniref:Uncharacterized protein n=1 Tax=marine sediment metagenome TaxID=412755 RepID=X1LYY7_9ZZZZ